MRVKFYLIINERGLKLYKIYVIKIYLILMINFKMILLKKNFVLVRENCSKWVIVLK